MNRAVAVGSLTALLALRGATSLLAAPNAPAADTPITIDPAIAKASAEADAASGSPATSPDNSPTSENPRTPYERALLNYKSGKYAAAKVLIDQADQEAPGDFPIEMLKVRILSELHDFHGAHQVLNSLYDRSDITPAYGAALTLATGDLNLRERHFDEASHAYERYLQGQPADADAKLKLVYARLGAGDLVHAGKLASEFKPLDAATPAYYFAQAALTRAGAANGDEDQDLQQARTIYGVGLTNRYLKTYLEVFTPPKATASSGNTKSAPSGKAE